MTKKIKNVWVIEKFYREDLLVGDSYNGNGLSSVLNDTVVKYPNIFTNRRDARIILTSLRRAQKTGEVQKYYKFKLNRFKKV